MVTFKVRCFGLTQLAVWYKVYPVGSTKVKGMQAPLLEKKEHLEFFSNLTISWDDFVVSCQISLKSSTIFVSMGAEHSVFWLWADVRVDEWCVMDDDVLILTEPVSWLLYLEDVCPSLVPSSTSEKTQWLQDYWLC